MIMARFLTILFFLVLMVGCVKDACNAPGHINQTGHSCYYKVKITQPVDHNAGKVTGIIPESVLQKNLEDGKKYTKKGYDLSNYPRAVEYSFSVADTTGLKKGQVAEFHSIPASNDQIYDNTLKRGKPPTKDHY